MALALIKVKIMPESPSTDLDAIESKSKEILEKEGSKSIRFEREDIAFGLIAVIVGFSWDDNNSNEEVVENLGKIEHVSSAEVIDYRRAFG
ncbi:MAG: elongation factor 1-beta [Candidatus Pacearchaeota archaeon]|jgi:translation elongation factor aEF-1 beta